MPLPLGFAFIYIAIFLSFDLVIFIVLFLSFRLSRECYFFPVCNAFILDSHDVRVLSARDRTFTSAVAVARRYRMYMGTVYAVSLNADYSLAGCSTKSWYYFHFFYSSSNQSDFSKCCIWQNGIRSTTNGGWIWDQRVECTWSRRSIWGCYVSPCTGPPFSRGKQRWSEREGDREIRQKHTIRSAWKSDEADCRRGDQMRSITSWSLARAHIYICVSMLINHSQK